MNQITRYGTTWSTKKKYFTEEERKQGNLEMRKKAGYRRKVTLIKEKGGVCVQCELKYNGSNGPVFQFHHRDPTTKLISIKTTDYSMKKLRAEVKKCDLLCSNCHQLKHSAPF